ncbi:hypothetical protein H5T51_08145 [Candidatus Bathyarchaeota archaeon]|nr:hypothetical protein [Candidatus Bathyarchaeota archaeon]
MTSDRGMDRRNSLHIPQIWGYIRNNAYMNELGEIVRSPYMENVNIVGLYKVK